MTAMLRVIAVMDLRAIARDGSAAASPAPKQPLVCARTRREEHRGGAFPFQAGAQ
jgi:hypothetical protein